MSRINTSRISRLLSEFESFWKRIRRNYPWIPAATWTGLIIGAIVFIHHSFFPEMKIPTYWVTSDHLAFLVVLLLFLLIVTFILRMQLRSERILREKEENFRYDYGGTLYNGLEPNIAFRTETFKGILTGLEEAMLRVPGDVLNSELIHRLLIDAGREAAMGKKPGQGFALEFPNIYDRELRHVRGRDWKHLDLVRRLQAWARYDSETGWGVITARGPLSSYEIEIQIHHHRGLYDPPGGHLFGYWLIGYCESVISVIVKDTASPEFDHFQCVRFNEQIEFPPEKVVFRFQMQTADVKNMAGTTKE